jgi:hypothetical protein
MTISKILNFGKVKINSINKLILIMICFCSGIFDGINPETN